MLHYHIETHSEELNLFQRQHLAIRATLSNGLNVFLYGISVLVIRANVLGFIALYLFSHSYRRESVGNILTHHLINYFAIRLFVY